MKQAVTIPDGKKLGRFEIVEHLGSGGMGEVYRARDPKFRRDVAIKILPADYTKDPERLQRFEQEAQAVGMLNHPNILSVYDTGMTDGSPYLVSEYVEGETLRHKIAAGAIPHRKAVEYALQLARGLAAAHEKGIIHRDLKPENVMITKDGRVKILDFGLAKLNPQISEGPLTQLPTSPGTQPGLVLGTIGYMSPEQVRGKIADYRSDIFAFGAILYEMITGVRAFRGETQADTLSAILQKEPPEISETNRSIPPALSRLVQHCLEKDPEQRFHSAGDIAFNLESLSGFSEHTAIATSVPPRKRIPVFIWQLFSVLATLALVVLGFSYYQIRTRPKPYIHLSMDLPAGRVLGPVQGGEFSLSPDGKFVAFTAFSLTNREWNLWLRPLDQSNSQLVNGSTGAAAPFWSPDSQYVAFFAEGKLKKIKMDGGPAQTLCDASEGRGGSWNESGTIVFSPQPYGGLSKISATGGAVTALTKTGTARNSHRWPYFLPDGKHFVFTSQSPDGIYVASLDDPQPKQLNSETSSAVFVKPGTLLFARDGTLIAQPFDPTRLVFTGEGVPILEQRIEHDPFRFIAYFSVSQQDSLVFRPQSLTMVQPTWFDRSGKRMGTLGPPASFTGPPVFSPDGNQIFLCRNDLETGKGDIWKYEIERNTISRITFNADPNGPAIWLDSSHFVLNAANKIYRKQMNTAANAELLLDSSQSVVTISASPDGKFLLFNYQNPRGDWDIWAMPLEGERKPYKFVETPFDDMSGFFSPDGKWVTFTSQASGQNQVYVASFPDAKQQFQVSTEGGGPANQWRKDGKELIYGNREKIMSVEIQNGSFGNPKLLFERPQESLTQPVGIHPDGQRFLFLIPTLEQNPDNIHFISNWTKSLKK
jgi:eukaryotic-like serine/threonine-protein kinase